MKTHLRATGFIFILLTQHKERPKVSLKNQATHVKRQWIARPDYLRNTLYFFQKKLSRRSSFASFAPFAVFALKIELKISVDNARALEKHHDELREHEYFAY